MAPSGKPVILHVTESYGGGVKSMLNKYASVTPAFNHFLLGNERRGNATALPQRSELFGRTIALPTGHVSAMREIYRQVRILQPDYIHAHSSFAGLYCRLALGWNVSIRRKLVYTPHGLAFHNPDISRTARLAARIVESLLSPLTGIYMACSSDENRKLARINRQVPRYPVRNAVLDDEVGNRELTPSVPPVVGIAARIAPVRKPDFFCNVAQKVWESRPDIRFVWVGDGDEQLRNYLVQNGVEVTGWMDKEDVLNQLASFSVFLHSAQVDGFPVSVLEAGALGLPIVVPDIDAFFECSDEVKGTSVSDTAAKVLRAIEEPNQNTAAWQPVLNRYADHEFRHRLNYLYSASPESWLPGRQNCDIKDQAC